MFNHYWREKNSETFEKSMMNQSLEANDCAKQVISLLLFHEHSVHRLRTCYSESDTLCRL